MGGPFFRNTGSHKSITSNLADLLVAEPRAKPSQKQRIMIGVGGPFGPKLDQIFVNPGDGSFADGNPPSARIVVATYG